MCTDLIDSGASPGLNPGRVNAVTVILRSDARYLSANRWIAEAGLKESESPDSRASARGRVSVFGYGNAGDLGAGRVVRLEGQLKKNDSEYSPFTFYASSLTPGRWNHRISEFRHFITSAVSLRLKALRPDSESYLSVLILGRQIDSGSPLMRRFREAGCMHLLALSGFHVGLIALAVRGLLKPVAGFRAATVLSAFAALFFMLLTGVRPSLLRAVLMYALWSRDSLKGYKGRAMNYLYASFVLQTLFFPRSTATLSFQLSYAALFGILSGGRYLHQLFQRYLRLPVKGLIAAGLGAQAATLPLVISAFGLWRPVGIAASVVLTPLVSAAMVLGSLHIVLPPGTVISGWAIWLTDQLVLLTERTAAFFAQAPPVFLSPGLSWLTGLAGIIIPFILIRRNHHEKCRTEPRFPRLDPGLPEQPGHCSAQALGAEFSD